MARLMLSAGMFTDLALSTAVRRRGLALGSPPPRRAAIVISRMILVKIFPRLASRAPFLCLMEAHLECPDIGSLLETVWRVRVYHPAEQQKRPDTKGRGFLGNDARRERPVLDRDPMAARDAGSVHPSTCERMKSRQRPTLPPGCPDSTIGARGLNGRVRNGNGCDPSAMITGMKQGFRS